MNQFYSIIQPTVFLQSIAIGHLMALRDGILDSHCYNILLCLLLWLPLQKIIGPKPNWSFGTIKSTARENSEDLCFITAVKKMIALNLTVVYIPTINNY